MQQLKIIQSVTTRTLTTEEYLKEIGRLEMVSPEEETELAMRIQAGDEEAFQRLVEANLRFVVSVAKQYQNRGLELSDLINEGNLGLMKAARKFDPTRGFKFISYGVWWIRQSIMQAISDQGRMVRLPLNQVGMIGKITKARTTFLQENEREPTDAELAALLDIPIDKVGETDSNSSKHLSYDMPFGDDGDGTLLDVLPDTASPQADGSLKVESLKTDLLSIMSLLNRREREIISLSFGLNGTQEMTLEEIGTRMDLTRERVRQIREKAIRKMGRSPMRERLVQYR